MDRRAKAKRNRKKNNRKQKEIKRRKANRRIKKITNRCRIDPRFSYAEIRLALSRT